MLVLTRREDESIMIGEDVEVKVLDLKDNQVKIGIVAMLVNGDTATHDARQLLKRLGGDFAEHFQHGVVRRLVQLGVCIRWTEQREDQG